jgi:nucleoside-diphosphate-sugar epimerase
MVERVLVIGGTGPTGLPLVRGLVARGHHVTILHRGIHEHDETPTEVAHIHADPYDIASLGAALEGHTFDATIVMYGRLRRIAELMVGRTGRFLSVGGVPAYRGWMNPWSFEPRGLPVPTAENGATVALPEEDEKGFRIVRTEQAVFEAHPGAAHVRYPYVYGPHQLAPREWCVVRRVLDGRRRIIVADDGLTLHHHGYTENLAEALLLAIDKPDAAAGKIFNVGDTEVLTIHQVIELICAELDHEIEIVSMPFEFATPALPMLTQPANTHRVLDLGRIVNDLGYADVVPARTAVGITARWLTTNQPEPGGIAETVLTDPFDYAAEDALIDAWSGLRSSMSATAAQVAASLTPAGLARRAPGYGLAYSGPGGRPRSQQEFVE